MQHYFPNYGNPIVLSFSINLVMGVTLLETAHLYVQIDTLLSINICAVRVFIKRFDCQEPIGIKKMVLIGSSTV